MSIDDFIKDFEKLKSQMNDCDSWVKMLALLKKIHEYYTINIDEIEEVISTKDINDEHSTFFKYVHDYMYHYLNRIENPFYRYNNIYKDYFNSQTWIGEKALKKGVCQCCGKKGAAQIHHWSYIRIGFEQRDDVIEVCEDCHRKIEAYKKSSASSNIAKNKIEYLDKLKECKEFLLLTTEYYDKQMNAIANAIVNAFPNPKGNDTPHNYAEFVSVLLKAHHIDDIGMFAFNIRSMIKVLGYTHYTKELRNKE